MDRADLVRRIAARSGLGVEEADRLLELIVAELSTAAVRRRPLDLGDLGRFEPEPGSDADARTPPVGKPQVAPGLP